MTRQNISKSQINLDFQELIQKAEGGDICAVCEVFENCKPSELSDSQKLKMGTKSLKVIFNKIEDYEFEDDEFDKAFEVFDKIEDILISKNLFEEYDNILGNLVNYSKCRLITNQKTTEADTRMLLKHAKRYLDKNDSFFANIHIKDALNKIKPEIKKDSPALELYFDILDTKIKIITCDKYLQRAKKTIEIKQVSNEAQERFNQIQNQKIKQLVSLKMSAMLKTYATYLFEIEEYKNSIMTADKSLSLLDNIKNKDFEVCNQCLIVKAKSNLKLSETRKSLEIANQVLQNYNDNNQLSPSYKLYGIITANTIIAKNYLLTKNTENAIKIFEDNIENINSSDIYDKANLLFENAYPYARYLCSENKFYDAIQVGLEVMLPVNTGNLRGLNPINMTKLEKLFECIYKHTGDKELCERYTITKKQILNSEDSVSEKEEKLKIIEKDIDFKNLDF